MMNRHYDKHELAQRKQAIAEAYRLLKWLDAERWQTHHQFGHTLKKLERELIHLETAHND